MAIALSQELPAWSTLKEEGVPLLSTADAAERQRDLLQIALLNLMPKKSATETQIARLLGGSGHDIALTLSVPGSYRSKNTSTHYLEKFYEAWPLITDREFDGLIITGAPVETLPFEDVTYWQELTEIFDWAQATVGSAYYICWAGQAALYHAYGVPKHELPEKMFGVFDHRVIKNGSRLLEGLGTRFSVPVSRHTEVRATDLPASAELQVMATSDEAGLCLIADPKRRAYYNFNHFEYDAGTLGQEYLRDQEAGLTVPLPRYYFPDDDPAKLPPNRWRPFGKQVFANWVKEVARRCRNGQCEDDRLSLASAAAE